MVLLPLGFALFAIIMLIRQWPGKIRGGIALLFIALIFLLTPWISNQRATVGLLAAIFAMGLPMALISILVARKPGRRTH